MSKDRVSRRDFLTVLGCCASFGAMGGITVASIRFMFPNILYEPPKSYKIGRPKDYFEGVNFLAEKRIFVIRKGSIFKVISAVCTHMGCMPRWIAEKDRWVCPCHGSMFDKTGNVIGGPAPRPLPWYEVRQARDGRLFVDERRVVPFTQEFAVKA